MMLILALVSTALTIIQSDRLVDANRSAIRVDSNLKALKIGLLDAETGQRGFVLTDDATFLEPYNTGVASTSATLRVLRHELAEQPAQLVRLSRIEALWGDKLAEMEQSISEVRSGQAGAAVALVKAGSGKIIMDEIRHSVDEISGETAERIAATQRSFQVSRLTTVAVGVIALIIVAGVSIWQVIQFRRLIGALAGRQAQLVHDNLDLASSVDQNTQRLQNIINLLNAVTSTTGEAIYARDRAGRMIFANNAALANIGAPVEEVIGRGVADYHRDASEVSEILRVDQLVMERGQSLSVEQSYTTGANRRIFLTSKAPIRSATGKIIGLVGVSTDITARKKAERDLHLSEQRFRAAVQAVEGFLWTNTAEGEMRGAQPDWARLTGQAEHEYQGYGWKDALAPEDVAPTLREWRAAVDRTRPFSFEHRVRCADGILRNFAVRAVPVFDLDGRVQEWVGIHIDISDERHNQATLQNALDRVTLALDAANMGAWEYIPSENKLLCDSRTRAIWAIPEDAPAAIQLFSKALHADDLPTFEATMQDLVESRDSNSVLLEHRIVGPNHDVRWVSTNIRAISTPGEATRLIGTCRDITLSKRNEERVQFLMRELTHRTKNSLAVVQAIARQSSLSAKTLEAFHISFQERLQGMAQSLNLLTSHNWEGVTIRDLIDSQLEHYLDSVQDRITLDGPGIVLRMEAAQNIGLALHELATNAAKYGALSNSTGRVAICWSIVRNGDADPTFHLHWSESGGPPVEQPESLGFGYTVIQRVVKVALSGKSDLNFDSGGVRWNLEIGAEHIVLSP